MNIIINHIDCKPRFFFNCNLCGKIFLQKGHLNRHTKNVHEGKKQGDHFVSEITNESENTEYHLIDCDVEIKEEWNQPEEDFKANPEKYPKINPVVNSEEHIEDYSENDNEQNSEEIKVQTNEKFSEKEFQFKKVKFLNEVHERSKPRHKCNTCDSAFDKSGELKRHIVAVHEGKKPYQCRICNECFLINSERKNHIETVHDGKNMFNCSICTENCSDKNMLKTHNKTTHGRSKPHSCTICDATFVLGSHLKLHSAQHTITKWQ